MHSAVEINHPYLWYSSLRLRTVGVRSTCFPLVYVLQRGENGAGPRVLEKRYRFLYPSELSVVIKIAHL